MNYRREIDGLRALAVAPVILFHAGFAPFSGGFVGVDVFFVISGYLITSLVLADLSNGAFSLKGFYERRARRILPALFFVMAACLPAAWLFLLPADMEDFSRSLVAVATFVSNLLFWRESGYFDTVAELKPLLHTWSLAVEEQFYMLFPLVLLALWRLGKRWTLMVLAGVFIASLAHAQWASLAHPPTAFFLLSTRAWELLIGAFAAFWLVRSTPAGTGRFARGVAEVGGWVGVSMILYAVFTYSKSTPFPGFYALVPTLGALLIILCATEKTVAGRFLAHKALVGIGLVSYSAYLWHQPLFAFARHRNPDDTTPLDLALVSVVALALAWFSWRYVETPFRSRLFLDRRKVFLFSLAGSVIFVLFGLAGIKTDGFTSRLDAEHRALLAYNDYHYADLYREGECFLRPEQSFAAFKATCYAPVTNAPVMVWGDSHAAALSYGLRRVFPDVAQYNASGCPPLLGVDVPSRPLCAAANQFVLEQIAQRRPQTLVLHANWRMYDDNHDVAERLGDTISYLQAHSPCTALIVIGGVPQYQPSLPTLMYSRWLALADGVRVDNPDHGRIRDLDRQLEQVSKTRGIRFFSALGSFCDEDGCLVGVRENGILMPVAWDYGHLTAGGSVFLATEVKRFVEQGN